MAEVFYRGSKVFWKVHSTMDVIIVKHDAEKVLEVVCVDPIMSREAARLYLRFSLLLSHISKDFVHPDELNSISEDVKLDLIHFIVERLEVTSHKAKSRTFQIEFQKADTEFECAPPSTLVPYNVHAPGTARKDDLSGRSTVSSSTASVSRSSTQRTDTKGREEFVEFRESMKASAPYTGDVNNNVINESSGHESNSSSPKTTIVTASNAASSAGAAILNHSLAVAGDKVRTNSQTCLPFSSKNNAPLIRTNSDPTTKDETHDAHVPAVINNIRVSPRTSPHPPGNISPTAASAAAAAGAAGAPRPYVKARRRSSVHATSTVLQGLPQCDKELAPLPSNRLTHVDTLLPVQLTKTSHPTNPPQHALTHTPTSHNKPKPHKAPHKAKSGFLSGLWCGGAGSSVNSVHPHGPR
eukprot:gene9085-10727_t